ncbi:divalent metal cation transporter [Acidithiobacillus thiooxidans]|uniref:NRAMP family divalent metal transporter n=1 Tax=Acidithiobacillus thiooxidans TaxID=930 RepID=UPI001C06BBD7|nr:NRAMP family divalent metal transporter [Acidithiobacillus thiooxidans]MBU2835739.1 divalent metal cation transporter [Acidithiobacillus thiooxidans]
MTTNIPTKNITDTLAALPDDQRYRAADRWRVHQLREALIQHPSFWKRLWLFFTLVGPGILVMIADNDAGGVITYAQTGATYGIGFFIPFLLLMVPVAYVVQEMTVRLGAVTGRGHAEMVWGRYGAFWGVFSLFDLVVANILTLVTEFIGVTVGMKVFGVPPIWSAMGGFAMVAGVLLFLRYHTWERAALWIAVGNLVFVPLAIAAHPHWGQVAAALGNWHIPAGIAVGGFLYVILANLGTTIAPWMLFFQQSSVVDKGLTVRDIRVGQMDTAFGSILMGVVAIALVALTGTWVYGTPGAADFGVHRIMGALVHSPIGSVGTALFALGLVEAGLIAAIAITASTSWAVGEALNLPRSINLPPQRALPFYLSGLLGTALAAVVVLIPHAPLGFLNLTVQVVASIFMPAAMLFLLMLLNDPEVMGVYVNRPWQNMAAFAIVAVLIVANGLYGVTVVFPHLF